MRFLVILCCFFSLLVSNPLAAHAQHKAGITLDHPWARPTFALAKTAAVYMTISNTGETDTLISVAVPQHIAASAEMHDMVHQNGMMSMREMTKGLSIVQNKPVAFAPGGKHIMLLGLVKPLKLGMQFPVFLTFENAGKIKAQVKVEEPQEEKIKGELHHSHHH